MKNFRIHTALLSLILTGSILTTSTAFAFPAIDFVGNAELATRYDATVSQYGARYEGLGITASRRITTMENRIARAYLLLSKAKTDILKKRYEAMVLRYSKTLDAELARIQKSKALSPVPTPKPPVATTPAEEIPPFIADVPTWTNGIPADFLYYSDDFEGQGTSNGNVFHQAGYSAARCDVPFNTLLQLRYADTGIIVKANDRPNCAKHADIVDLTRTGFTTLAPVSRGRISGSVNNLGAVANGTTKEYLSQDFFSALGIKLDASIPNLYLPNETFRITGQTTNGESESLVYIVTPSGKKVSYGMDTFENNRFEYLYPLTEVGNYEFVVASGRSFSGVRAMNITVLDPKVLESKQYFGTAPASKVTSISTERREAGDLTATNVVTLEGLPSSLYRSLTIQTPTQKITRTSMGKLAFLPSELMAFSPGETANVTVTGRTSSTPFSHDTYSVSSSFYAQKMTLGPLYEPEHNVKFDTWTVSNRVNFTIKEESPQKISGTAFVITPSGKVDQVKFGIGKTNDKGILDVSNGANFSYLMKEEGVYLVEVNYDNGFAAIIEPVIHGNVLAILPNEYDFSNREIETSTIAAVNQTLASVNAVRKKAGLNPVEMDNTLSKVAQFKAKDMSDNNYVGHIDSQGEYIRETAKRAGFAIAGSLGENVAGGTVSASFLQAGLSLSGGHRANMLGNWTKVGIGIVIKNGKVHLSEVFGE